MSIFLALSSALATAIYYVYVSQAMKRAKDLSSSFVLGISHLAGAITLLPLWCIYSPSIHPDIFITILTPLLLAAGLLVISRELYFYAYSRTDVANITVFSALTPVYAIGTGYVFLGEVPSTQALIGIWLICCSIYALFLKRPEGVSFWVAMWVPFRHIVASLPIACAFLSTIPTAFAAAFQKQLLHTLDPFGFSLFLLALIGVAALVISVFLLKPRGIIAHYKLLPRHFLLISAIMLPLMHVLFSLVIGHQQTAVSLVLQRTSIVFQIGLAYVFLQERRDLKKRLWVIIAIMGGFILIIDAEPEVPLYLTSQNIKRLSDDPDLSAVLDKLTAPSPAEAVHPISCAVVGNSGNLRGSRYGELIDAHSYVFRMNGAPIHGYEQDVGARTTHHILHSNNPHAFDYGAQTTNILVIDEFNILMKTSEGRVQYRNNINLYLRHLAGEAVNLPWNTASFDNDFPDNLFALKGGIRIVHPAFIDEINDRWFRPEKESTAPFPPYPSTGFKAVVIALRMCDKVDLFGFGSNKTNNTWDHYYDSGDPLTTWPALHRADYQEQFLDTLEARKLVHIYRGNLSRENP